MLVTIFFLEPEVTVFTRQLLVFFHPWACFFSSTRQPGQCNNDFNKIIITCNHAYNLVCGYFCHLQLKKKNQKNKSPALSSGSSLISMWWRWLRKSTVNFCIVYIFHSLLHWVVFWVLNHQQKRNSHCSRCQSVRHSSVSDGGGTVGSLRASGQTRPYGRRCSTAVSYSGKF